MFKQMNAPSGVLLFEEKRGGWVMRSMMAQATYVRYMMAAPSFLSTCDNSFGAQQKGFITFFSRM